MGTTSLGQQVTKGDWSRRRLVVAFLVASLAVSGNVLGFGNSIAPAAAVDAGECSDASGTMTCNLQGQSLNFSNLGATVLDTLNETASVADVYRFDYNSNGLYTDEGDVRVDALMTVTARTGGSMRASGANLSASISTGNNITVRVDFSAGGRSVILQNLEVSTSDLDPGGQLERVRYSGISSYTLRDGTGINVSPSTAPSPETGSRTFLGGNRPGGSDGDTVAVVFQPVSSIGLNPFTDGSGGGIGFAFGAPNWGGSEVTKVSLGDAEYTITYHANGAYGGASPPAATTAAGAQNLSSGGGLQKTVSGQVIPISSWNTLENGTGVKLTLGGSYRPISNITLYAQYENSTITFKKNGGTSEPDTTQVGAGLIALDSNPFERDGFAFAGWNTTAAGDGLAISDGGTFSFGADDILYAQWSPIYTITYNSNSGAGGTLPSNTLGAGALTVGTPTGTFSRAGADFSGWNTEANGSGTDLAAGASFTPSSDITLYAQYDESLEVPGSAVDAYTTGFSTIGSVSGSPVIESKGFAGDVRVVISTNDSSGDLRLPSSVTANLTKVAGYDNSTTITASGDRIAFEASQADANIALAALEYESSGSSSKTDTITVEVANAGVPELQIGSYFHYYEYVDVLDGGATRMTWDQAFTDSSVQREVRGETVTGWMATIGSEDENAWITQYLNSDAWLGATDEENNFSWKWVTPADDLAGDLFFTQVGYSGGGTTADGYFSNWASGEPNDYNNGSPGEDCAQFYARNSKTVSLSVAGETLTRSAYWNDLPCSGSQLDGYIWEYRSLTSLTTSVEETFSVSVTTPEAPGRPDAPTPTAGYKSVALSWTAPGSTGTFPISDYKVEYATDPLGAWSTFSDGTSASTSATVTGLTPGTTYYFRVIAFNAVFGNASDTSTAVTLAQPVPRTVTAVGSNQQVIVAWTPPSVGTATSYMVTQSPGGAACTVSVTTCTFSSLTNGTTYSYVVQVTMSDSSTYSATAVSATPAAPVVSSGETGGSGGVPTPAPVVVTPTPAQPRVITPSQPTPRPGVLQGPVTSPGRGFDPSIGTRASVGGSPATVTKRALPGGVSVQTGTFQFGMQLKEPQSGGGVDSNSPSNSPEIRVPTGQSTQFAGGGLLPGSQLQVWLPGRNGDDAKELARVPVKDDGTFDMEVSFTARQSQIPIPIGRQVMQVAGFDENGNQTVVDMTINVSQGAVTPELNREQGDLPELSAGSSLATSAGFPTAVNVVPLPNEKRVSVGDGSWNLIVDVDSESGVVGGTPEAPVVQVTQDSVASAAGDGFMPGTTASVWMFSDPTLMGTATVGEDGSFTTEFVVDSQFLPVGNHTLQIQGVGDDGYIKAANLGVEVKENVELTTASASGLLWWVVGAFLLVAILSALLVLARRRRA